MGRANTLSLQRGALGQACVVVIGLPSYLPSYILPTYL